MATSYSNPGGTGHRAGGNIITYFRGSDYQYAPANMLIDNSDYFTVFSKTGYAAEFLYMFGAARIVDEFRFTLTGTSPIWVWEIEGNNTGFDETWTPIATTTSISGAVMTLTTVNTTPYKYYRVKWVSGSTASTLFRLVEFKIDDYDSGWYDEYSVGNRSSLITLSNTAGTSSNLLGATRYDQGSNVYFLNFLDPVLTLAEAKPVSGIRMVCAQASNVGSYYIDGSNDNSTWVTLSGPFTMAFAVPLNVLFQPFVFEHVFANNATYKYIRLRRNGANNGSSYIGVLALKIGHSDRPDPQPTYVRRRQVVLIN